MAVLTPVIPTQITVHLGRPDSPAENVTVPFVSYIKNVASGEIYPTWPESALRANIYAITTFALNRIYTEWYPSRGYDFDITSTTAFDQTYQQGRETYENIDNIVDEIFNDYVVEEGEVQPFFTSFCNGTTSTCAGLSQWGTVDLANSGLTPIEILRNYYGNNINIVENAPVQDVTESYPGSPLMVGMAGNDVKIIQQQLNRIGQNYPAIPYIEITTGIYDRATENAVRKFQEIFNLERTGTVDKKTWYEIKRYYNGVKGLGELISEGVSYDEATLQFSTDLSEGNSGIEVETIQYYLNVLAYFNSNLNAFPITSQFDVNTKNAVQVFQNNFGVAPTGVVDRTTWDLIVGLYSDVVSALPSDYSGKYAKLYPGYFLTPGSVGENVLNLQTYLAAIAKNDTRIPPVTPDGFYGDSTRDAVYVFQEINGLPITGSVGPVTWRRIAINYDALVDANLIS